MNNEKRLIDANRLQKEHIELYGKRLLLIDTAPTEKVDNYAHGYQDGIRTVLGEQRGWIPIKTRELTEEEKEEYPDCTFMYDCPLPEDGEEVLVTTWAGGVDLDTFCRDDGCYFENYCDEGDVVAWMPKPKPYDPEGGKA